MIPFFPLQNCGAYKMLWVHMLQCDGGQQCGFVG